MTGVLAALVLSAAATTTNPSPALTAVRSARTLPVQYDGRVMPLDTLAHRAVEKVSGAPLFRPDDPVAVVLSWIFEPQKWLAAPIIRIGSDPLAHAINVAPIDGCSSYQQLATSKELWQLVADARQAGQDRLPLSPLQEQALRLQDRLLTLARLTGGAGLPLVPHPRDVQAAWMAPESVRGYPDHQVRRVQQAWQAAGEAFVANRPGAFAQALAQFKQRVVDLNGSGYAGHGSMRREVLYNHLLPVRLAWLLMLGAAMLRLIGRAVRPGRFDALANLVQVGGFAVLTIGLLLRWDIAGRIPAANFYESLVLLGWGIGAFSLVCLAVLRDWTIPLNAGVLAGLFLALADLLPIDPWVRPIAPVLANTVWMSVHVPIIMLGYAILAQSAMLGHIQISLLAFSRVRGPYSSKLDMQLYWCLMVGSLFLLAGVLTGSMWANSSWGRYWGWDPKEVWSLAALMGYMALLHARFKGWLGPFGTAAWSLAAIWLIVGTYLVVNFVLPIGLHSYAFGSGDIVMWMSLAAAAEAALVTACYVRYSRGALAGGSA